MTEPVQAPDLWPNSPWADDDSSTAQREPTGPGASQAVLRPSLILLIASTIVIFLSAIASSNAAPSSPLEQIALVVHRASMFAMLVAFVGILAAYRIPVVMASLQARNRDSGAVDSAQRAWTPDMPFLLTASGLLIAWVWGSFWLGSPALHQLTYWMLLLLAGLLANMAILHKGCIRAFAVGTLVTMLLVLLSWRSLLTMMMMGQGGFGSGRGSIPGMLFVNFNIEVTLSVLSGLACAFYYNLVMRVRSRSD